jgi:hypothetical protein
MHQTGLMLSIILKESKLYSLLHQIDVDLAERARIRGCPSVGGLCTVPLMSANLVVVPRISLLSWFSA